MERFLQAQKDMYGQAIKELRQGRKVSHWMWYIFPQLRFLGYSSMAKYYGIADEKEAKEYCANPVLYNRYIECCKALEALKETNPEKVMGDIDALKLRSSLTLFYMVDENNRDLYKKLIDKFYNGKWDEYTIDYLVSRHVVEMRLNRLPFERIASGEKTIEVRLYDEKRRKIQVGNLIRFIHVDNKALQIQAQVIALHRYKTFKELFQSNQFSKCGFNDMSVADAVEKMYEYYTPEEEKNHGVVGIEIKLTK